MNRQQKENIVADFQKKLNESQATFVIGYKGLNVALMQALRKTLRAHNSELKVTKARLMKKATELAAQENRTLKQFQDNFKDQIGLVFSQGDISATAKQLIEFSKKNQQLEVISALFESKILTKEEIKTLASLPSREELLAMFVATIQNPIASLVKILHTSATSLLYMLKQVEEQKKNTS